jgi:hypothetical protein
MEAALIRISLRFDVRSKICRCLPTASSFQKRGKVLQSVVYGSLQFHQSQGMNACPTYHLELMAERVGSITVKPSKKYLVSPFA